MDSTDERLSQRSIGIDLDDNTSSEVTTNGGDDPPSELSLGFGDNLQKCLDSDEEPDIELIDEFLFEGQSSSDSKYLSYHDDEEVKQIEDYLKSDSFDTNDVNKYSKLYKKSEEQKKLIVKLIDKNKVLRQELFDFKEQIYLKDRQINNLKTSRSRILCFRCAEPAAHPYLCCWNGCYCSKKCQDIDWFVNEHFNRCLKSSSNQKADESPSSDKRTPITRRMSVRKKRKLF